MNKIGKNGKKIFAKKELHKMYVIDKLTISEMCKILETSYPTLNKRLIENGFKKKEEIGFKQTPIVLTQLQKDILEGGLLGDASLMKGRKTTGTNACIQYMSSVKEHVEFFQSFFKENAIKSCQEGPIKSTHFDIRTNNTYTRYTFLSVSNNTITKFHEQWYKNGKKIIPPDLKLNSKICLMWYLGDGSIQQDRKFKRTSLIKLSTNSFTSEEIENILIPQLSDFEAYIQYTEKHQPVIIIPRRKIKNFLSYIGKCPVKAYKYKWKVFEYKDEKFKKEEELTLKL